MANLIVTNTNQTGPGSLSAAITTANQFSPGADTITFAAGLSGSTIDAGELLVIRDDLTIIGDIDGDKRADITISGGSNHGIFYTRYGVTNLHSLNIAYGSSDYAGGSSSPKGGGAILNKAALNMFNSSVNNSFTGSDDGGGGIFNYGTARIYNSTIKDNFTNGLGSGGAISNSGNLTLVNSTVWDNTAANDGGGIFNKYGANLTVINSTFRGNRADPYDAQGGRGGGIYNYGTATITNSIITANSSGGLPSSIDIGNNPLVGPISAVITFSGGNIVGTAANLGPTPGVIYSTDLANIFAVPLPDNNGPVTTLAILQGGLAHDAGVNGLLPADTFDLDGDGNTTEQLPVDGRGFARINGGTVDLGAFETGEPPSLIVTTASDVVDVFDNETSLREAITFANSKADASTITFEAGLTGSTLLLTLGDLAITQDITIDGDTNSDNKADITIDGGGTDRIFAITGAGIDVDLLSLTLTNGNAGVGGAIYGANFDSLDIVDTTISNNASTSFGGALSLTGGGTTNITNSLISGNAAASNGGGAYVRTGHTLNLTNTTVEGNTADGYGGGIVISQSTANLFNSTVTGNQADASGPNGNFGGGIVDSPVGTGSTLNVTNSVIALNTSGNYGAMDDVIGTIDDASNSFIGTTETIAAYSGGGAAATANGGGDPLLDALADNGGSVQTQNIQVGSALIDAGDNALVPGGLTEDANGNPRILGSVDIGAVESNFNLVVDTLVDENDGDFSAGDLSLREAISQVIEGGTITFANGLSGGTITLTQGELSLTKDIVIDGDTNADNKADITIDGNASSRIFNISGATTDVDLLSLAVQNGSVVGSGGAIHANNANTLDIVDTTIAGSTATIFGGGLRASETEVTIINSLLAGNMANQGGGASFERSSAAILTNTTVHNNQATSFGGGIVLSSYTIPTTVTLNNSTITGNLADSNGTFLGTGGGVAQLSGSLTLNNSVIADNTSGGALATPGSDDVLGTITNAAYSFIGTTEVIINDIGGNINGGGDPMLGTLGDHSGTVETRNIQSGSALIDAGDDALVPAGITTDANGNPRFFATVDIGAAELQPETAGLIVTTLSDVVDAFDHQTSLREAVALANSNADASTITFDANLAGQTIILGGTQLALSQDVTIDGDVNGDNKADITIDGDATSRIFSISGATTDVDLLSLTLSNGNAAVGGAINSIGFSSLDIADTTFLNNTATTFSGGAIRVFGNGVTSVVNSLFTGNDAKTYGGAIYVQTGQTLNLTNTTLHGNTADAFGGGLGGSAATTINIFNSTITGNQADADGGSTTNGGGIGHGAVTVNVYNSVIAENTSGTSFTADDVFGGITSASNSFFGTVETISSYGGGGAGATNNGGGAPGLQALADNGGTVQTRAMERGSTLFEAGDATLLPADIFDIDGDANTAEALPLDANGNARIEDTLDIGAVEAVPEPDSLIVTTTSDVVDAYDDMTSLREALAFAASGASGQTVTFDAGTFAADNDPLNNTLISPTLGTLTITQGVTINGDVNGDGIADVTIDGSSNGGNSIFKVNSSVTGVGFESLTLQGASAAAGGALNLASSAGATILNSTLQNNYGTSIGGAIFTSSGSTLAIANSTFTGNGSLSGAIDTSGTLKVMNSTFSGNYSTTTGSLGAGAIFIFGGATSLYNSTISGNYSHGSGGGVLLRNGGTLSISNSIVAGNSARLSNNDVGGTITSSNGSNIFGSATAGSIGGDVILDGVTNTLAEVFDNVASTIVASGSIVIGGSAAFDAGVLADNGGPTRTIQIETGGLAVNNGDNADVPTETALGLDVDNDAIISGTAVDVDQTGNTRTAGGITDIGAVEGVPEADSLIVTSLSDVVDQFDGKTSLREAVNFANSNVDVSTITFDASIAGGTIILGGTRLLLTQDVTVDGDTDADNIADITIDADHLNGVFGISGADATLDALTITGGSSFSGGGVSVFGGGSSATIANSTLSGNSANSGGGISVGTNTATTLINSTVSGNTAADKGGGIRGDSNATITLINSTIAHNTANAGGGIYGSSNTIALTNSTVSGNTAQFTGGIHGSFNNTITLTNSTVTGNADGIRSGGIYNQGSGSVTTLTNSIVAGNQTGGFGRDIQGANAAPLVFTGGNIIGSTPFGYVVGSVITTGAPTAQIDGSNQAALESVFASVGIDPHSGILSGVLADNGGPIETVALAADELNPALDAGLDVGAGIPATDARGQARIDQASIANNGANISDIGAFEFSRFLQFGDGLVNTLTGTAQNDELHGFGEADTLLGLGGDDYLRGGDGDDTLDGGTNGAAGDTADYSDAASGIRVFLTDTNGQNTLGSGRDTHIGIENLIGSAFDDSLYGDAGDNVLEGGDGADRLVAGDGADILRGGDGDDILKGKDGDGILHGGAGNDKLVGGADNDMMFGGAGNDTLIALAGLDTLSGGDDDDFLFGGKDNDVLHGDAGADNIRGNLGNDILNGGSGVDTLRGGGQNDIVNGGDDNDFLFGENHSDILFGGAGDDSLTGGSGLGVLDGFADTFVYKDTADGGGGFDRIKDFENGIDVIDLTGFAFADFAAVQAISSDTATGLRIDTGGGNVLFVENFFQVNFDVSDVLL